MRGKQWGLLGALLALAVLLTAPALGIAEEATEADRFIHEEPFSQAHTLEGMFANFTEYFHVGEWDVHEAQLSLVYATTPLVIERVSDMTLYLNGQPFYSQRIEPTAGAIAQLKVDLPVDAITDGLNSITLSAYIRTNEDDPCTDDAARMGWMDIHLESGVAIDYTPMAQTQTIADFYTNFSSIDALENEQSAVVIPDAATRTELTVAGLALSGMANNAVLSYDKVRLDSASGTLPDDQYLLYIAEYDRLMPDVAAWLDADQEAIAKDGALLALLSPAEGQHILLLTGTDTLALENAGRLLGNPAYMSQFIMASRAVGAGEDVSIPQDSTTDDGVIQLTETGESLKGVFRQSHTFYVENDPGRVFAAGSQVELAYRYADNLDFDRAMISVYVNGTPIGSRQLTASGANGSTLILTIPYNIDVRGDFTVEVAFDLEMVDTWCTQRAEEMPWAYISPESTLDIQWEDSGRLLLDYYPSPFIRNGRFDNVAVILPDAPTDTDLLAFCQIVTTLGRSLRDNLGQLSVLHMSEATGIAGRNTILIGRIDANPLAAEENEKLYFRFSDDQSTLLSNEKLLIDPAYGTRLGTVQLIAAGDGHATLVLSAVRDEEVGYAASYLGDAGRASSLSGDAYIASSTGIQQFKFSEDNAKTPSLYEQLMQEKAMLRVVLIGGGVAVILVVAAVMLLIRYRKRGKK